MLPEETVKSIMKALMMRAPSRITDNIKEISAPNFRNWQGVFVFKPGTLPDLIYEFAKLLNEVLKNDPNMLVGGKTLYVSVDKPAWKKLQNSLVAKAERALKHFLPSESNVQIRIDWSSGQLWQTAPVETYLGGPSRTQYNSISFKWSKEGILALGVNFDQVVEAFDSDF
jgi:hypothetical protein